MEKFNGPKEITIPVEDMCGAGEYEAQEWGGEVPQKKETRGFWIDLEPWPELW